MAPWSRNRAVDGRAHPRTTRGTAVPGARAHQTTSAATLAGVTHRLRPRHSALPSVLVLLALAVTLVGCATQTTTSFDPASACTTDGRMAGAYPDLEARVPTSYEGRGPDRLDSGRHCSETNLGSLAAAGFDEVRFAGGTWDFGGQRAAALVVFQADGLTAERIAEFYGASADAADRTQVTGVSTPTLAGRTGHRLDTSTGSRTQTVVTWPSADPDFVNVVITNDLPDPKIEAAVEAFGGR
jgi:hypothetical protein